MKVYVVWGIEYHSSRELQGIYRNESKALERKSEIESLGFYDEVKVQEVELDEDIEFIH